MGVENRGVGLGLGGIRVKVNARAVLRETL